APAAALPCRPAVGQPQLRAVVAAVLDEPEELAVVHQPGGDLEARDEGAVARPLVIEGEPGPVVAEPAYACRVALPLDRGPARPRRLDRRGVRRAQRAQPERMLEVRQ